MFCSACSSCYGPHGGSRSWWYLHANHKQLPPLPRRDRGAASRVQACLLHLIRNTFRYASRKYWDQIGHGLRPVYTAANEAEAKARFAEFAEKWGKSAERCRFLDSWSMSLRSMSKERGLTISSLLTQPGECSTTQTFAATSGTRQSGRLAWRASHLTIFAIQQLRWRSVRERTSRLCSDCSVMRQRR